jgi:phosphoglycerol transferase MdoB-like AlkP superfamily enzyme
MRQVLIFFIKYFFFWFLFFIVLKFMFLIWNHPETMKINSYDWFGIFWYGSKMDMSVAGYFSLVPGLVLALWYFLNKNALIGFFRVYTVLLLAITTIIGFCDVVLFRHWGTRLGILFINAMSDPVGVSSSIKWWQLMLSILICILWVYLWYRVYRSFVEPSLQKDFRKSWKVIPAMLVLTAFLILPIRGGLDRSPLNHSSVSFSKNYYANQAAFNYFWSFIRDFMEMNDLQNPALYMEDNISEKLVSEKFLANDTIPFPVYIKQKGDIPPNVVLIILESFSNKLIATLGGEPELTPGLNRLSKEGITFTQFFTTGNRSDKGLSGLIGSYPALLNSSILKYMEKTRNLDFLPAYFEKQGYSNSFYYGGDINFYNTRLLMLQSGVNILVSKTDFPSKIGSMSKWGVPDEYLYERFLKDLPDSKTPFLKMIYTISSHDPFDVPFDRIEGNRIHDKYLNSIAYADSCLADFVEKLKRSPLWENTLLVITSDHGALEPGPTTLQEPETYQIPMIWLGGVIDTTLFVDQISMQTDLAITLAKQMGWETKSSPYAKNIFGSRQFAFYLTETGWGYLEPELSFFFDRYTHNITWFKGQSQPQAKEAVTNAKAYIQYLHTDFLNR